MRAYMQGEFGIAVIPYSTKKGHSDEGHFLISHSGPHPSLSMSHGSLHMEGWSDLTSEGAMSREYRITMLDPSKDWHSDVPTDNYNEVAGYFDHSDGTTVPSIILRGVALNPIRLRINLNTQKHYGCVTFSTGHAESHTDGQRKWIREAFEKDLIAACLALESILLGMSYRALTERLKDNKATAIAQIEAEQLDAGSRLTKLLQKTPQINKEDVRHLTI